MPHKGERKLSYVVGLVELWIDKLGPERDAAARPRKRHPDGSKNCKAEDGGELGETQGVTEV